MKLYRERLHPALSMFFYVALVIPASIIVFIPTNPEGELSGLAIGIATGIVLYIGVIALFVWSSPIIEVTVDTLRVGRAVIPRELLGRVHAYEGSAATEQRGTALDARAWLCIRGWVKPVIRVTLIDPQDPTPYWLVSTRHPDALVQLLDPRPSSRNEQPITQGESS